MTVAMSMDPTAVNDSASPTAVPRQQCSSGFYRQKPELDRGTRAIPVTRKPSSASPPIAPALPVLALQHPLGVSPIDCLN